MDFQFVSVKAEPESWMFLTVSMTRFCANVQLISEAYDILKNVGGLTNPELAEVFKTWNEGELKSFLVEISQIIFTVKDDQEGKDGYLLDVILVRLPDCPQLRPIVCSIAPQLVQQL